ncbi:MAG: D-alanyl-D-alanine carboxypeptidase family protein [Bacteriovoracaceae bacterium]
MNEIKLKQIYQELGITDHHLKINKLSPQIQPPLDQLVVAEIDFEGKPFILEKKAAEAWFKMKTAASKEQIFLMPFSGFRSIGYQRNLIQSNLAKGRDIDEVLTNVAIPGFSEHHTGRAIDFHELGKNLLDEDFEKTESFEWLTKNAYRFNFYMSYPRDNPHGIIYEPWHWFYKN